MQINNAVVGYPNGTLNGSVAEVTCNEGYNQTVTSEYICMEPGWNGDITCTIQGQSLKCLVVITLVKQQVSFSLVIIYTQRIGIVILHGSALSRISDLSKNLHCKVLSSSRYKSCSH